MFLTTEKTTIPIGQVNSELVNAIQGTPYIESFTGTGTAGQVAVLGQQEIDISTLRVTTGNILWTQVDSFLYSQVDDFDYYVEEDYLGAVRVYFGDGKYGRVPSVGETISIQYLRSSGEDGNVGAGSISIISGDIYTLTTNTKVQSITVTNPESAAGGSNKQSLEQVKIVAPGALSALYRPMTKYDYNALLIRLGGIQHVNVWGEQEEEPPAYENMNWVNISLVPTGGGIPSQNLKEIVKAYLLDYQPITVRVRFIDPEYIRIQVSLRVYILPGASTEEVRIKVTDTIRDFFDLENVKYGQDIRASRFYKLAMAYDEVNHVFVDDFVLYDEDSGVETTIGQEVILQKWQIPVLDELSVAVYSATELPIPDLYPDETLDKDTLWDYDG
jgi:predicted phage baseplate assembly protein